MLSVVVINKNRLDYLALKIQCLMSQTIFSELDILVVDYSHTQAAAEYCRRRKIRCLRVKGEFTIARARNVGIRNARTEWICISGNDTIIDRKYFARLNALISIFRGHKVYFSGSYANFVAKARNKRSTKIVNLAFSLSRIFDWRAGKKLCPPLRSLLLAAYGPLNEAAGRRELIANAAGKAQHWFAAAWPVSYILKWLLLKHLLKNSIENDECLEHFRDLIFSPAFMKDKLIEPLTFQTFSRAMAEELHGYDESIVNWGLEDGDFKKRACRLGYQHIPTKLVCLHLEHPHYVATNKTALKREVQQLKNRDSIVQPHWGLTQPVEEEL